MALYTKLGELTVIPAADLAAVGSAANKRTSGRVGDGSIGKHAGLRAFRDNGSGDLDLCVATGSDPTAPWLVYGRETTVTPA